MRSSAEVSARSPRDPFPVRVRGAIERRIARARKRLWQRRHLDASLPRRAAFLVGSQRSGTNMFHRVIDASPYTWIYNEDARAAFENFRIRPRATIARLIERSPAPLVLFKPLCDSRWVDRLLDAHPGSRAVWMFRQHTDVVNSMVQMWGEHQSDTVRRIHEGRFEELGWRGERLSEASLRCVRELYRPDLSAHEGGLITWYLRNTFFFELGLDRDPRVWLQQYEDLVLHPAEVFERIFAFLEIPFEPRFAREVSTRSIAKAPFPEVAPEIRALAEGMQARLCDLYRERAASGDR